MFSLFSLRSVTRNDNMGVLQLLHHDCQSMKFHGDCSNIKNVIQVKSHYGQNVTSPSPL